MEAPAPAPGDGNWTAGQQVAALPEMWALFAEQGGDLVEAWRLTRVCKASEVGVKGWLGTLPGLVVCGGRTGGGGWGVTGLSWRLDLATMRWAPLPSLVSASAEHACCTVRGALVVLGGRTHGGYSSRVEILSEGAEAFVNLPPLSRGKISGGTAIAVDESESAAGRVLLIVGVASPGGITSSVHLVDLATGICTPQPEMLNAHYGFAAAKMMDGRVVCAGGRGPGYISAAALRNPGTAPVAGGGLTTPATLATAEVFGPPLQGGADAAWTWRALPDMSVDRFMFCGCMMCDGRFAVFGGGNPFTGLTMPTCEALTFHGDNYADAHWEPLLPMHDAREGSTCAAVAGCVIVAGGDGRTFCEVYHEARGRWLRLPLPCDVPCEHFLGGIDGMGSALL
jgi:hypothetical protein